jgi:hypothetical protein
MAFLCESKLGLLPSEKESRKMVLTDEDHLLFQDWEYISQSSFEEEIVELLVCEEISVIIEIKCRHDQNYFLYVALCRSALILFQPNLLYSDPGPDTPFDPSQSVLHHIITLCPSHGYGFQQFSSDNLSTAQCTSLFHTLWCLGLDFNRVIVYSCLYIFVYIPFCLA